MSVETNPVSFPFREFNPFIAWQATPLHQIWGSIKAVIVKLPRALIFWDVAWWKWTVREWPLMPQNIPAKSQT